MISLNSDTSLAKQAAALIAGEPDIIAKAANISALIFERMPNINWAGFYIFDGKELVLGPFQGKVACVRIPLGKGVCGTAALKRQTVLVADVHKFPGHIACDSQSNSEIVIPIIKKDGSLFGVLDIDAPIVNRFTEEDKKSLEELAEVFAQSL